LFIVNACASAPAAVTTTPEPEAPPVPGTPEARRTPSLPPIPTVDGALRLEVGYPPENATIAVRDSNFIFGSTGSGRTQLTINGIPVEVAPNGGFLAFIPVPADGVYRLSATRDAESATLERRVRVPAPPAPPTGAARIMSPYPTGAWAVQHGETIEIGFRGPAGGQAAVLLPDGTRIPLIEQGVTLEAAVGDEFRTTVQPTARSATTARYSHSCPSQYRSLCATPA
jgi:N-acetylmuramoyl-L-alanine amidase